MKPAKKKAPKPRTLSGKKPVPFKDVVQKLLETAPERKRGKT